LPVKIVLITLVHHLIGSRCIFLFTGRGGCNKTWKYVLNCSEYACDTKAKR
jgi:hypothetical protein